MIFKPIYQEAKSDDTHPLNHLTQRPINFTHVESLHQMFEQFNPFTDFFDSAQHFNVSAN